MTSLSLQTRPPAATHLSTVALIQPLPSFSFPDAAGYSEFPSLGFAILAQAVRTSARTVGIHYLAEPGQLNEILADAEVIVLGDLRYYAYFCNPAVLIRDVLTAITRSGWTGQIIVTGRHAGFLRSCMRQDVGAGIEVSFETDFVTVGTALGLEQGAASKLGHDPLPAPAAVSGNDLVVQHLLSQSRPVRAVGQLMFTTGCRYACRFCEKAGTPVASLIESDLEFSLERFRDAGAEGVIFWDEVFGQDGRSRPALLRQLSESGLWFNCNTRMDMITEDFAEALAGAGCRQVLFGIELDPSEAITKRRLGVDLGKGRTVDEIVRRVGMLAARDIEAVASVIVGLPDDTNKSATDRVMRVSSLGFSHVYVRPLVPFPESELYKTLVNVGEIAEYGSWLDDETNRTFPHGYPTLGSMTRGTLQEICGR